MFRKTRNRIMLLNMVMVSAVVIAAFAVVFITAFSRERASNSAKLHNYVIPQVSVASGLFGVSESVYVEPGRLAVYGFERRIVPDAGLSFSLLVDSDGNLVEINSMVDLPDVAYRQAVLEATKGERHALTVALGGRTWQYSMSPVTVEFRESSDVAFFVSGAYNDIRFLDVTDSYRMLWSLGLTLAGLTVVILAAFFFISRYFANRAIRPMEEAFEKQNRFVADASHELKTPLAIIDANCGVLYANRDETMDSQIKWVDSITRAADRMAGLVGNLLSLARMEDKEHEILMAAFDMSQTVIDAVSDMEQAALEKGLNVEKRIEPGIEIKSDKEQTRRILTILLDNAIKYTESGGEITISLTKEKRHVVCAMRNSGEGIPQKELPRLFDRFYRGDPARTSENGGFGLGLAIAKAISERLGAKLTATSAPGQHTEFRLLMY